MSVGLTLETVIEFLLETALFKDLRPEELADIIQIMQVQEIDDGEAVFRETQEGDSWYVLFDGVCTVTKASPFGGDRSVAELQPHACFGEMAVLDDSRRSATVSASGSIVVFRFPRRPFQELLLEGNLSAYKLVAGMARVLCQRQRSLTQHITDMVEDESIERLALKNQLGALLDQHRVSE